MTAREHIEAAERLRQEYAERRASGRAADRVVDIAYARLNDYRAANWAHIAAAVENLARAAHGLIGEPCECDHACSCMAQLESDTRALLADLGYPEADVPGSAAKAKKGQRR